MRVILCCLGLLFATPAFATPVEDGLCHARPQSVETMEKSEKLCRAFVRALGKLPGETMKELHVSGGGEEVWADGARMEKARLLEVKHVSDAERSPFIPGSKCGETARTRRR